MAKTKIFAQLQPIGQDPKKLTTEDVQGWPNGNLANTEGALVSV
jgi:hypothetical protein